MLLPVLLVLATSDATARASVNESFVQDVSSIGTSSIMHGVTASAHGETMGESATSSGEISGFYGRSFQLSLAGDSTPSPNNYSGSVGTHATFQVGPTTQLFLDGSGFLATRFGVRATDLLAARDPFLSDRLEYATAERIGLGGSISNRAAYRISGSYLGAGGLASSEADAVGVDLHGAAATLSFPYELTQRSYLTPELRYGYSHFYHALLDRWLTRGEADIHTGTGMLGFSHVLTRRLMATVGGGVTIANPPPILESRALIVSPEVRAQASYLSRMSRATLSYEYGYTSLGPRIGYGHRHAALAEFGILPASGQRWRDLELRWIASVGYGVTPVAGALLSLPTAATVSSQEGTLSSLNVVAGIRLDVPLIRGVMFTAGYDLQFARASFDPPSPTAGTSSQLVSITTIGIAAVLSTNPNTMVFRSMLVDGQEERQPASNGTEGEVDVDRAMRQTPAPREEPSTSDPPASEKP
jgi:hypothetical protein